MKIRRAKEEDIKYIQRLLLQVHKVHHIGRPDLFRCGGKKYTEDQLKDIIKDDTKPIFVAADEKGAVVGYVFCIFQQHIGDTSLTEIKTLYIDDLCVDENVRKQNIGKKLYETAVAFAKENNCYNVTLNVWSCNESAMKFYEKCGLKPQKIGLEKIL